MLHRRTSLGPVASLLVFEAVVLRGVVNRGKMRGTRANTKGWEAWVQCIPCPIDIVRLVASRFILEMKSHDSCVERKLHLKTSNKVAKTVAKHGTLLAAAGMYGGT